MNVSTRHIIAAVCAVFALAGAMSAGPHLSPKPLPSEMPFIHRIQTDLGTRFASEAAAERAGYFRYTNEDETGAISFTNLRWHSTDPAHPSQLWYDVHGRLLGADFSVPGPKSAGPPHLWGIDPRRWVHIGAHIHYVIRNDDGKVVYGATSRKKFVAAGGDPAHPDARTLVALGIVSSPAQVEHVFEFPSEWDLIVWILPNPDGAFAWKNPLVHPSPGAGSMPGM
jgi:hypothetical protein